MRTLFCVLLALATPLSAFANGGGFHIPNSPFGPMQPGQPADVRWLDDVRQGEQGLVGRLISIELRDRGPFYFRIDAGQGWTRSSKVVAEGVLLSFSDQGSVFFYTLRLENSQVITVIVGGTKSYSELQGLRSVVR